MVAGPESSNAMAGHLKIASGRAVITWNPAPGQPTALVDLFEQGYLILTHT
jgi:hypothetical protein